MHPIPHLLLAAGFALLVSCSKGGKLAEEQPADTPSQLLQRFTLAMHEADRDGLVSCVTGSRAEKQAMASIADFGQAVFRFRDAFVRTYGQEEWERFLDPEGAPEGGDTNFMLLSKEDVAAMKDAAIEVSGDKAHTPFPNTAERLSMIKTGQGWLVEAASLLPPGAEADKFATMMDTMTQLIDRYGKAIGHSDITGEDIDAELGKAMMREIFGISFPGEARFDIDKIAK